MKYLFIHKWREWELAYQLFPQEKHDDFSLLNQLGLLSNMKEERIFTLTLIFEPKMEYSVFIWKHYLKLYAYNNSDLLLIVLLSLFICIFLSCKDTLFPWFSTLKSSQLPRTPVKSTTFSFTPAFWSFSDLGLWNTIHWGLEKFS